MIRSLALRISTALYNIYIKKLILLNIDLTGFKKSCQVLLQFFIGNNSKNDQFLPLALIEVEILAARGSGNKIVT